MSSVKFPIAVHFVWHPDEKEMPEKILEQLQDVLFKKKTSEFSGCNEIPFFFYSSSSDADIPNDVELQWAKKNIIFIFSGVKLVISDVWHSFLENVHSSEDAFVVPVSIDSHGLNLPSNLQETNAIRLDDFPEYKVEYGIMCICHAIQRILTNDKSALKIFLSHCKLDSSGVVLAQVLQSFIKTKTGIKAFFDATEIQQGYKFKNEIDNHLDTSSVLAICTDNYPSRYWCQYEILHAKEKQKPMLLLDLVAKSVDRFFPALGNIPCIRLDPDQVPSDKVIFDILTAILVETIRCNYVKSLFDFYSESGWIKKNEVALSLRPPEVYTVLSILEGKKKICYPEPQIFGKEICWLNKGDVKNIPFYGDLEFAENLKVGISVSDFEKKDFYGENHIPSRGLDCFSHNIARQLVLNGVQLIYGGDFRKNGFTDAILDEIKILAQDEENEKYKNYKLMNYLAWPLYNKMSEYEQWYADNINHLKKIDVDFIGTELELKGRFINPDSVENKYLWSINLTKMREDSIRISNARICAGGRFSGYKGKMPGVLEEIIIALKQEKPLFLIGAFGGVVGEVCKTIESNSLSEFLTEKWQIANNSGYIELQAYAKERENCADYTEIKRMLENMTVKTLAERVKLSEDQYRQLMQTPSVDEAIRLVLLGLSKKEL